MKPKLSHFFTRSKANAGATFILRDPDTNEPSGVELQVVGFESDSFLKAVTEKNRDGARIEALEGEEKEGAEVEANLVLAAALVTGWNYDEPFDRNEVIELLRESPYIRRDLEQYASERKNFLGKQ